MGLTAVPAGAMENEPTGFGKARFGMTVAQVSEIYPQMEKLTKSLGAAVVEGPLIERRVLWKEEISGLSKPVNVELRFWKDQLWVVIVYFGENDLETVVRLLTERHGPPSGKPANAIWEGKKSTIMIAGKARWYSIQDNAISKEAQAVFMEDFKRAMERRRARRQGMAVEARPSPTSPVPTSGSPVAAATP